MSCARCTPGCRCNDCMMAFCDDGCDIECRCFSDRPYNVTRIDSPRMKRVKAMFRGIGGWFSEHSYLVLGIAVNIAAAIGIYRLLADFNKELEGVPHEKAIRLGFVILLIAIGLSSSRKS